MAANALVSAGDDVGDATAGVSAPLPAAGGKAGVSGVGADAVAGLCGPILLGAVPIVALSASGAAATAAAAHAAAESVADGLTTGCSTQ